MNNRMDPTSSSKDKFYVQFSNLVGTRSNDPKNMVKDDFYTITLKNPESCLGIRKESMLNTYEFTSKDEALNFINYCSMDFARFCVAIYKNNTNLHRGELELLPYLDFKESWDDAKLYKHFGIDQKTQDYITNFLPDFHGIRQ